MALFIRTLKKQPEEGDKIDTRSSAGDSRKTKETAQSAFRSRPSLDEWDNTIWTVMVEKAIVHRNGEITFVFYNGTEIKVGA